MTEAALELGAELPESEVALILLRGMRDVTGGLLIAFLEVEDWSISLLDL